MKGMLVYDDVYLEHKPPTSHPENPRRLRVALSALRERGLDRAFRRVKPRKASLEEVLAVHDREYVDLIELSSRKGYTWLDWDTYISPKTFEAALHSTGGAAMCAEMLVRGEVRLALLTPRPPGHHAGRYGVAMGAPTLGFCIFNNVAVAAAKALSLGLRRVAIVDFDVHHGNGTQDIFWEDPRVLHVDLHEADIYPGTGYVEDLGGGEGEGTKVNVPFPAGLGDPDYAYAWREVVEPLLEEFKPELILVSAGFDAHDGEPLALMKLSDLGFKFLGSALASAAERLCGGRLLVVLEGGYSVGLESGFPSFVEGVLERRVEVSGEPSRHAVKVVEKVRRTLSPYWGVL